MRIVDLFSGCGGMSLGFQKAGYEVVAAFDKWKAAVEIYKRNFRHPVIEYDLNDSSAEEIIKKYAPDMIIGGPPCQDFSIAGKRNMGERANLTIRFAEIVASIKPEWFVMENVYNIVRMPVLPRATEIMKAAGYGISQRILDASYCGVPQTRKRFFMIGHFGDEDGFIDTILANNLSAQPLSLYDYVGDRLNTEFYYMHPRSYNRRAIFSIYEPSATIRGVNRPMPSSYKPHPADKTTDFSKVRSLTSQERSIIQTFPENFIWIGTKSEIEQAIGNAVPVNLAYYVASCISQYIKG